MSDLKQITVEYKLHDWFVDIKRLTTHYKYFDYNNCRFVGVKEDDNIAFLSTCFEKLHHLVKENLCEEENLKMLESLACELYNGFANLEIEKVENLRIKYEHYQPPTKVEGCFG